MDSVLQALGRAVVQEVRTISRVLGEHGFRSWIVGGSVRDVVLAEKRGLPSAKRGDWDMCTDATPDQVSKLFRKVIPTGIEHGTVTIVISGQHFEVTTLRGERGHSDGRRPDEVFYVHDLNEDLARRDFTVNAMAYDIEGQTFHDPFGGQDDLALGLLRAVGDPLVRFSEDGLRVLRCARFAATLEFEVEEETARAIRPSLPSFEKVAQERVTAEWFKALAAAQASRFLRVVGEHGLLSITLPEVFAADTFDSPAFLVALAQVDAAPPDPLLRLAIFISLGTSKGTSPAFFSSVPGRLRLSRAEGTRLKLMLEEARSAEALLGQGSAPEARRWLHRVGREFAQDVLTVQRFTAPETSAPALSTWHNLVKSQLDSGVPLTIKDLVVTGADLMDAAAVPKGPELGRILGLLLEAVLEDPAQNNRETLLALSSKLHAP